METNKIGFVHLHVHTQYSLLDGAIRIDDLLKKVSSYGMNSVAITDHGTMFGVLDFYLKSIKAGIKPIIGCECYLTPKSINQKTPENKNINHILLLAKDLEGYENLCKLATIAQFEGFYYKPRIDKTLLRKYRKGLICLSACLKGEIAEHLKFDRFNEAKQSALSYLDIFGENNFFLEIQNNGLKIQNKINQGLYELSQELSIPMVATNDCHYLESSDYKAHEILLCIKTQKTINDKDRFIFDSKQLYVKSPEEMANQFVDFPGAIENSIKIAEKCDVYFDLGKYHFPKYSSESNASINRNADDIFDEKVRRGFFKRLTIIKENKAVEFKHELYSKRLEYEIKIIKEMGFSEYFLIVSDFVEYAKKNEISVGPGRGSAAGSLASYSLGITDLDPIEHGLIFERFLNPARVSMPDIDVDFCINGRERIHEYLFKKYGGKERKVAQITTFGTMRARMVIRDVGRAIETPFKEILSITKLIPEGPDVTIDSALKIEPKLEEKIRSDPSLSKLIEISKTLEGLIRHTSTHAAGIVISDKPIVNYIPLYKGKRDEIVTQFDMKGVENIGLIKFDLLGLKNLTVIDNTLKIIAKRGLKVPNLSLIKLTDNKTYELLQQGNTTGVFQLESTGMKNLMIKLKPQNFDEITALIALYRPGPLDSGMVAKFVERKNSKKKVKYSLASLKPILNDTYGIMVYQEQVMEVAVKLAGYSMADADSLRKAIGKKIASLMNEHRKKFVAGATKRGINDGEANKLFDLIEKFGGYGFNKSHSAAYAIITYRTAYLKANYPTEFMAALLTSEIDNIEEIVKYVDECNSNNIDLLPPDINESDKKFTVYKNKIRFGLAAIKNVGSIAVNSIIRERENNGFFTSIFDLFERVDLSKINKRVIESLICCGALDSVKGKIRRSQLMSNLGELINYGQNLQKKIKSKQQTLNFSLEDESKIINKPPELIDTADWHPTDKALNEKKYLGFYFSGHPLNAYKNMLRKFTNINISCSKKEVKKFPVRIAGIIDNIREFKVKTKKGGTVAVLTLDNMKKKIEVIVYQDAHLKYSKFLTEDKIVLIQGKIKVEEGNYKVIAFAISDLEHLTNTWKLKINFTVNSEENKKILSKLREIVLKYPGECNGYLHVKFGKGREAVISMGNNVRIDFCEEMLSQTISLLGDDAVKVECLHSN